MGGHAKPPVSFVRLAHEATKLSTTTRR
jgi:hypothetical protein